MTTVDGVAAVGTRNEMLDRVPFPVGKRTFDVALALIGLLVVLPVLAVAALGVKLSSRGPALFRQIRIGRDGQPFTMYKLRTYPVDHVDDEFSRPHAACPLPFGRFLRRTSIDELPQLLNVLRGDMSIVGPRPERPHFAHAIAAEVPGYEGRHRAPGGITGLAQVEGYWGDTCIESRSKLDNEYIDTWSWRLDLEILLRTPLAVIRKARA